MGDYILTIDPFGSATLEDDDGNEVWFSDDDDEAREQLGDMLQGNDVGEMQDVIEYLEAMDVIPSDVSVTVVQQYADGSEEQERYEPAEGDG